jgi:hypothetical protein
MAVARRLFLQRTRDGRALLFLQPRRAVRTSLSAKSGLDVAWTLVVEPSHPGANND